MLWVTLSLKTTTCCMFVTSYRQNAEQTQKLKPYLTHRQKGLHTEPPDKIELHTEDYLAQKTLRTSEALHNPKNQRKVQNASPALPQLRTRPVTKVTLGRGVSPGRSHRPRPTDGST